MAFSTRGSAIALALVVIFSVDMAMAAEDIDPQQVLSDARILARQGKYEEALQKHLWFHENALKQQPSLSAVRLSFALSYWAKLGEKYPKAKDALVSIREEGVKQITEGKGSFDLFQEVSGINRSLDEETKTVELFKVMHEKHPKLAAQCYHAAERYLLAEREYKLCLHYISDPVKRFDRIKLLRETKLSFADNERFKGFAEESFQDDTCRLIEILVGAGRPDDAQKVSELAFAVKDTKELRAAIKKAITPEEGS
jgi:hypothetical protein